MNHFTYFDPVSYKNNLPNIELATNTDCFVHLVTTQESRRVYIAACGSYFYTCIYTIDVLPIKTAV